MKVAGFLYTRRENSYREEVKKDEVVDVDEAK